jgi:hypothetical protein
VNQASGASVWTAITQRQPKARKATDRGRVARSPRVGACVAPLRAGGGRYAACRSGAFVRAYRIPQFRQLLGVVDADRARGGLPPGGGLWNFPHRSFRPTRVDVLVRSSAPGKVTPRSLAWIGRRSTPGSRTVRAEPPAPTKDDHGMSPVETPIAGARPAPADPQLVTREVLLSKITAQDRGSHSRCPRWTAGP